MDNREANIAQVKKNRKLMKKKNPYKKGSLVRFLIVLVLTVAAVLLVSFVIQYFRGG